MYTAIELYKFNKDFSLLDIHLFLQQSDVVIKERCISESISFHLLTGTGKLVREARLVASSSI